MTTTLEFESPHFLQSLFAHDLGLLKQLEEALSLTVTTRDGWVRLDGPDDQVERAQKVFSELEKARRKGGEISPHTFRFALETAVEEESDTDSVAEFAEFKLLGSPTKPPVSPRTRNQLSYLRALQNHDATFGIGPAGTGKTFLAMAFALDMLKKREIDRIVLTRPAVEAGEALGFLPGALEEKVLPYLRPLYDALNDMIETAEARKFAEKNLIEIAPLAYMRGRTLNRACVILDEAQNSTREQMLMFLTRLGEDSKCIVTGDPSQIDLRPAKRSGLLEAMRLLKGIEGVNFTEFEGRDVVRHPGVRRIIKAYDQGRDAETSPNGRSS
ncbi:MAG: PhoH family protein [Verrucomicrobiales bacterium]|nr:PhoH family protein [Verrucomicrobiales bacterium]